MAHFLRIGFFTFLLCLSFLFTSFNDLFDIIENDCSSHFLKGEGERDLIPMNQFEILHSHVNYAAAAYCRNDQLKNWTCGSRCVGEVIIEKFFHDNLKGACGYIAYNKKSKSIIIAFRGSQDLANWAYNLEFALLDYEFPGVEGALVHRGIYEVYDRVKSSILWNIQWMMMREENSCRGYDIIVTGHSLGGALASFLAIDIKRYILDPILDERINGIPFNINLTTIGEPRVGNEVYAKIIMNELIFQTTPLKHHVSRITHRNDVITHLPPSKSGFVHHPHEIWVKNIDETYICRDIDYGEPSDDLSCSAGALFFDISVHLFIWDINFTPLCTCDT